MNVGVVVARFQIDELHTGHEALLKRVIFENDVLCVVLGGNENRGSRRNPLDFIVRKTMVENWLRDQPKKVPLVVLFQQDQPSDYVWSANLDRQLRQAFPGSSMTLYGGRDSFLSHYHGEWPTKNLTDQLVVTHTATQRREQLANQPGNTAEFRRGVIYGAYNTWPRTFICVDIAVLAPNKQLLLGKRKTEEKHRFFGGFVDQNDFSLEMAAMREVNEEAGIDCEATPTYITSGHVNDYRYQSKDDGLIMTSLFLVDDYRGTPCAGDDIDSIVTVSLATNTREKIVDMMVPGHQSLMRSLLTHLKEKGKFHE